MSNSTATATWSGDLKSGSGTVKPESRAFAETSISWAARTERPSEKTSPEELIAAAHAGCFSMAFSNQLAQAGHAPERLETAATVTFVPGTGITRSALTVRGRVPGMAQGEFERLADAAKNGCPVSKALMNNVELSVEATLED